MNCKQNLMLDNPFIAYAHHRIILDESGKPHDYEYLEVNAPFEKLSELKKENLLKQTVRKTLPHILGSNFDWIATFGQIALEGGEKVFEYFNEVAKKWYRVYVYSKEKFFFTSMYIDITKSKKQAEELEVMLHELLFALPFGVVVIDPLTRQIEQVNEHITELFGAPKEQLLGHRCHSFLCPADEGACPVCDLGKIVDNSERVMLRADGSKLPILKTVKRVSLGGQDKLLECFVDISERKRTEEIISLRLSLMDFAATHTLDELLQKTLDEVGRISDSPIGFYHFVNEDQKTLSLQAWSTRTLQEFCKADGKGLHYPLDQAGIWADCARTKEAVIHNDYQSLSHRKGLPEGHAQVIRELVTPVLRGDQVKAILGVGNKPTKYTEKDLELVSYLADVCWDIVERKRADEALFEQTRLQKTLVDISTTFINLPLDHTDRAIKDALARLAIFTNTDRSYIFMYDLENQVCNNTYEWCADGIAPQIEGLQGIPNEAIPDWTETLMAGNTMYIPDVLALDPNSGVRQILEPQKVKSLIVLPMMDGATCIGFVGFDSVRKHHHFSEKEKQLLELFALMLINLLNRNRIQTKLTNAMYQAETASKAKSLFLANMSHEIRTPLNGVIGFTDLLKNTPLSPVQQQYVENANVSGHTLLGIINDILDFSKIEAGMMNLEVIKTDMIELLENSIDIIKYSACKKELEVLLSIDQNMPRFAMTDPIRLKQILANLLSNAVKFTDRGEIELKVHYTATENNKGKLTFYVRDTGIGISEAQKEKLFKSFSQADSSTTRKYGGTGLGLSISQMIVEKMGGQISIESKQGEGSTFYFDLIAEFEHGKKLDITSIKSINRCLVIDDNANNRIILERMLVNWNIASESCENGFDALKTLETSKPFDLIICDYHMPYLNGLETIKMIREKLNLNPEKQPIILLHSSSDDAELHKKCDELGILFRLTKPVKSDDLFHYLCNIHDPSRKRQSNVTPSNFEETPLTSQAKILIAEDIEMNMLMIKALLGQLYPETTIIEASNGIEAVDHYKTKQLDIIFMDVQMPQMDGIQASLAIRKIEETSGRHIPIIALTAGALKEEKEACLSAGMDDFLSKPIDIEALKKVLQKNLEQSSSDNNFPSFDKKGLLQRVGQNYSLYINFLEIAKNMPEKLKHLNNALQFNDPKEIKRMAHNIKGTSSMLSFVQLAKFAEMIEELDSPNTQNTQALMDKMYQEWEIIKCELEIELAK